MFGIATKPPYSRCYNSSQSLWMRRAYNGVLYNRGRQLPAAQSMSKIHPGDVVRCEVDMDEGTVRFRSVVVDCFTAWSHLAIVLGLEARSQLCCRAFRRARRRRLRAAVVLKSVFFFILPVACSLPQLPVSLDFFIDRLVGVNLCQRQRRETRWRI